MRYRIHVSNRYPAQIHGLVQQAKGAQKADQVHGSICALAMSSNTSQALNDVHVSRSSCPSFRFFFFLMWWLWANLGQYDRSPLKRVSCMHVANKHRILEPKFPETEYFKISLKRSEFPPNDNVKLSYDMIYWKPRPQEWNQCASIGNSH